MFTNMTSLSLGHGLASALDTLCSQAFGAGKPMQMGIYLQTGLVVLAMALVPMCVLNWHCGLLLQWLGQDPEVAQLAGEYARITTFSVPFLFVYELHRKVLQAQNIINPMLCIAITGNLVTLVVGYWLTYHTAMGFGGAALAVTISDAVMTLCLGPFYWYSANYQIWWHFAPRGEVAIRATRWQLRHAVQNINSFCSLGVPGILMVGMEWWAYELMAFLAGWLPDSVVSVSAYAVLTQISSTLYMVYFGLSVAGSIRIGNALGANLPRKAALISRLTVAIGVGVACVASLLLMTWRHALPGLMTNDPVAIERASKCLLALVAFELVDGTNCVLQGILRGTGQQRSAAVINGVAFFVVGIPMASLLAFEFALSVEGLWIGIAFGLTCAIAATSAKLSRASWSAMALQAQQRID